MAMSSFEQMFQPVMTFTEIAEELGCTHQRVHQIYRSAMAKLRKASHQEQAAALITMIDRRREYAEAVPRRGVCL